MTVDSKWDKINIMEILSEVYPGNQVGSLPIEATGGRADMDLGKHLILLLIIIYTVLGILYAIIMIPLAKAAVQKGKKIMLVEMSDQDLIVARCEHMVYANKSSPKLSIFLLCINFLFVIPMSVGVEPAAILLFNGLFTSMLLYVMISSICYYRTLARKQLVLKGNHISYTPAFGSCKNFHLSNIARVVIHPRIYQSRLQRIGYSQAKGYSATNRLFTIDSTCVGYDLLMERLKREGIVPIHQNIR